MCIFGGILCGMLKRGLVLIILFFLTCIASSAQSSRTIAEIKLMDKLWIVEAYFSDDLRDFDRIVADDFLITGGNGKIQTKAEKRANVVRDHTDEATRSQPGYIFAIEPGDHRVRVFGRTAISNGSILENYTWNGAKINNRVYFTNTYLKRHGRWQVVASQFTYVKQK